MKRTKEWLISAIEERDELKLRNLEKDKLVNLYQTIAQDYKTQLTAMTKERDELKEEKCHSNNFKETKKLKNDIFKLENNIDKYKLIVNCNEIKIGELESQLTTLRKAVDEFELPEKCCLWNAKGESRDNVIDEIQVLVDKMKEKATEEL